MLKDYLVRMKDVSKRFGGVIALENVNFSIKPGEVHVLLGENGAGKSTLMKILSGVYQLSSGELYIKGKETSNLTPKEAQNLGISIIHQELSLINELSVAENIFVGRLPETSIGTIDYKKLASETSNVLKRVGLKLDSFEMVETLKISHKQLVEIAKALSLNADVIIMDEPTSSLTFDEVDVLFDIIRILKKEGVGIVYISHKLDEVMEIGDRVTVLKDGKYVGTEKIEDITTNQLITMMVGKSLSTKYSEENKKTINYVSDKVKMEVKDLKRADKSIKGISFSLYKGEVLGFFGLIGSGRTETVRAIIGADKKETGQVIIDGKEVKIHNPYDGLKMGIGLIPENRTEEGFFDNLTIWQNVSLPNLIKTASWKGIGGLTKSSYERELAENVVNNLNLKCDSIEQSVSELSGGNQQKVVVGKWLEAGVDIYIFDEPTRGIDVGVKQNIYNIINELAKMGKSIILVSSELPELLSICDRIIVFKEGKIAADYDIEEANKENIMYSATIGKKKMEG
ncbi:sugar ABC transporter ATP-binding protein [Halocella sp. SP3-1]|uniref:sugar ABC transporter ATP-binding protein n=1 Tax=Halocella sp. SP3-1 TaxID=2382161 RepID=UPI000F75B438|nr:sugar ABC transporter ATP-binding protein [Halocella sp. SP3-1]AZO93753.1 sugar ABC transporter ATP-binding protein [Halocella sp. SP3-1]